MEKNLNFSNLSEKEKGYLFGLFEGDGYKNYNKKDRHYKIEFYLNSEKDKDIINNLFLILKKANLSPSEYQDKRFNCKKIRLYSKELFNILSKNINLSNNSQDFGLGFISGIIDSEGCVNLKKHCIDIVNTNKQMLDQCQKFLNSVNIHTHLSKRKRSTRDVQDSYRMYISVKIRTLPHISIKVIRKLPNPKV